jgi:Ni/Co efflux regulator RcnB
MRIFMKLAFMSVLAIAAIAMPGASSNAAVKTPAAMDAATEQSPLLHEVSKKRHHWGKKWWGKRSSHKWRGHKKFFRSKRHRRFYSGPSIYLRYRPRHYYYDDYYYDEDDAYYSSSCGTVSEKERCARRFKSFNWDTCKYTTYSGHKRLCPYVD